MSGAGVRGVVRKLGLRVPALSRIVGQRDALLAENAALRSRLSGAEVATQGGNASGGGSILDSYVLTAPTPRAAFGIFGDEWSSDVPGFGMGQARHFQDGRIDWLEEQCGGFAGKRILELGPLEGGHTFMMASRGASHIVSIEANTRAFLKCLIVKNALGFNATYLLGDFREYLKTSRLRFDFALASGVLYHMTDPIGLLRSISQAADSIGIWTHYYDPNVMNRSETLREKFEPTPRLERVGEYDVAMYQQRYLKALEWKGFCGGSSEESYWITKQGILDTLKALGFVTTVGRDEPDHPNGPCLLLLASRITR